MQRTRYASSPWTEEAEKRRRYFANKDLRDRIAMDALFFALGAFSMLVVLSRFPLPW